MMMKTTMMMKISNPVIRRGSIKDIDQITEVENKAFGSHAYDYPALRYMLGIANSITTVATLNGKIVGYATVFFRKNSKISHLESIAVDPDFQNAGIGKMLMGEVERISLEMKCSLIVLETFEKNVSALKLYERSGFTATEVVQDYYHSP
ncbi:MAG: GNAT family N-acetyltransferase, partial [Thermoplasmatales archaeon]